MTHTEGLFETNESEDGSIDEQSEKEVAWQAFRQAWNEKDSMDYMTPLEKRTARTHFEEWWSMNYE